MKPLKIVHSVDEVKTTNPPFLPSQTEKLPISRYVKVLSATGDFKEAAANFFSSLIELDREDVDIIYAERVPESVLERPSWKGSRRRRKKGSNRLRTTH